MEETQQKFASLEKSIQKTLEEVAATQQKAVDSAISNLKKQIESVESGSVRREEDSKEQLSRISKRLERLQKDEASERDTLSLQLQKQVTELHNIESKLGQRMETAAVASQRAIDSAISSIKR